MRHSPGRSRPRRRGPTGLTGAEPPPGSRTVRGEPQRRRTGGRAIPLLEPRPAPEAQRCRRARAGARQLDRAPVALAAHVFPRRDHAGAVAAGAGPRAPVPEDPQQIAQHRGRAQGQGRIRACRAPGDRAGAALAAADHPDAAQRVRWRRRLRAAVLGVVGIRRRIVPGPRGQGRVPVPRDPQLGAHRRRGGSREPRLGGARRADRTRLSARDAPGDRHGLPQAHRAHAAAELRAAGQRRVPHRWAGQPQSRDPGLRPGAATRTEVRAVPAARAAQYRGDLRAGRRWRHPAAPPVRFLHPGAGVDPAGRRRPQRAGDQADAVPDGTRVADRRAPGAGSAQRQGRHRRRRAARTLRRRGEPGLRRSPATSGRAGGVRRRRIQDACQDAAGGASRRPQAASLRAFGDRQLPAPRVPIPTWG